MVQLKKSQNARKEVGFLCLQQVVTPGHVAANNSRQNQLSTSAVWISLDLGADTWLSMSIQTTPYHFVSSYPRRQRLASPAWQTYQEHIGS